MTHRWTVIPRKCRRQPYARALESPGPISLPQGRKDGFVLKKLILPWRLCQNQACLYDLRSLLLARLSLLSKSGAGIPQLECLPFPGPAYHSTLLLHTRPVQWTLQGPHACLPLILDVAAQARGLMWVRHMQSCVELLPLGALLLASPRKQIHLASCLRGKQKTKTMGDVRQACPSYNLWITGLSDSYEHGPACLWMMMSYHGVKRYGGPPSSPQRKYNQLSSL